LEGTARIEFNDSAAPHISCGARNLSQLGQGIEVVAEENIICERQRIDLPVTVTVNFGSGGAFNLILPAIAIAPPVIRSVINRTAASADWQLNVWAGGQWGGGVLYSKDITPGGAAWDLNSPGGKYFLEVEYASGDSRAVYVNLGGETKFLSVLEAATGGFTVEHQCWRRVGEITLMSGSNRLGIGSYIAYPHIRSLRLIPIEAGQEELPGRRC
jgi:hypothetical protein